MMLNMNNIVNDTFIIKSYRNKAESLFHKLDGIDLDEIESLVRVEVERIVTEYELDVKILDVLIYGSRAKGTESVDSDLDVIVYYCGSEREDSLFNILHEEDFFVGNVVIDINPISQNKTGSLSGYIKNITTTT